MLGFAIIGCGSIGKKHAINIQEIGKLISVCDIIKERAESFAELYSTTCYFDHVEMLKNEKSIDIVVICSPNGLHAIHTINALSHGFHVLCEKPMALTVNDCIKMIAASEKFNKRLFIVMQNRFNPPVVKVKQLLNHGILGNVSSIQVNCFWNRNIEYYENPWRGTRNLDGGVLFTQFSHFIDLLFWYFGDVKEAKAYLGNFNHKDIIEFEDTGVVNLLFNNGIIGSFNYTINSYNINMEGSITIFGSKGTVKIGGQYLNKVEYQNIENYFIKDLTESREANNYGTYFGSMSNHDCIYKNILDVFEGKAEIATNGFEGLKTVEIIKKIYDNALNTLI